MRRLRVIFAVVGLYLVLAAPMFLPGDWRLIVQPATADAVEVYTEPLNRWDFWTWDVRIEPFNNAVEVAEKRALGHPRDLAPPYIIYERPFRLVIPHTTSAGKGLATAPITVWLWHDGRMNRYTIVPRTRPAQHGIGELRALFGAEALMDEPEIYSVSEDAEHNRIRVEVSAFDQGLRRRLARAYGDRVAICWQPFTGPATRD